MWHTIKGTPGVLHPALFRRPEPGTRVTLTSELDSELGNNAKAQPPPPTHTDNVHLPCLLGVESRLNKTTS